MKNRQPKRKMQIVLAVCGLLSLCCLLLTSAAVAQTKARSAKTQTKAKPAAQLAVAKQATVNGSPASSGLDVATNSQIKTAADGAATLHLGTLGRIELGAETDFTLRFEAGSVRGDLSSGRAVLTIPAGVETVISTNKGLVTTDGEEAATLTIEIAVEETRVSTQKGEGLLVSSTGVESIPAGEEIYFLARSASGQRRQNNSANAVAAAPTSKSAKPAPTQPSATVAQSATKAGQPTATSSASAATAAQPGVTAPKTPAAPNQAGVSVSSSAGSLIFQNRDPDSYFMSEITCRDHESTACRRRSSTTP